MIYTLTLNPAIDQIIEVPNFQLGETNKATGEYEVIGGKGINVAVMLHNLGYSTTAWGFLGQKNKEEFYNFLVGEDIPFSFHEVDGKTRTNMKIKSLEIKQETELNGVAFSVTKEDIVTIMNLIKTKLTLNDCLIMSGSIPRNCDPKIYQYISEYCQEKNIPFVVDTTKKTLIATLAYQPFLIKPNLDELNELFATNYHFNQLEEIIGLGKKLQAQGAQNVLISSGKDGSILITTNETYLATSAVGQLVNSVGAGDSMVAGFVGTYFATNDYQEALLVGTCAGSATAFSQGIAEKSKVDNLREQIRISKI